jgi:hypothetical protein
MIAWSLDHTDNNGNYCGSTSLRKTAKGALCIVHTSNGQDLYRESGIEAVSVAEARAAIDGWKLDDDEVAALAALGITEAA